MRLQLMFLKTQIFAYLRVFLLWKLTFLNINFVFLYWPKKPILTLCNHYFSHFGLPFLALGIYTFSYFFCFIFLVFGFLEFRYYGPGIFEFYFLPNDFLLNLNFFTSVFPLLDFYLIFWILVKDLDFTLETSEASVYGALVIPSYARGMGRFPEGVCGIRGWGLRVFGLGVGYVGQSGGL